MKNKTFNHKYENATTNYYVDIISKLSNNKTEQTFVEKYRTQRQ